MTHHNNAHHSCPELELQILKGIHFKATAEGHVTRPLYTKEYLGSIGHQGQVRGHQRPWPQMASGKFKPCSCPSEHQRLLFKKHTLVRALNKIMVQETCPNSTEKKNFLEKFWLWRAQLWSNNDTDMSFESLAEYRHFISWHIQLLKWFSSILCGRSTGCKCYILDILYQFGNKVIKNRNTDAELQELVYFGKTTNCMIPYQIQYSIYYIELYCVFAVFLVHIAH